MLTLIIYQKILSIIIGTTNPITMAEETNTQSLLETLKKFCKSVPIIKIPKTIITCEASIPRANSTNGKNLSSSFQSEESSNVIKDESIKGSPSTIFVS